MFSEKFSAMSELFTKTVDEMNFKTANTSRKGMTYLRHIQEANCGCSLEPGSCSYRPLRYQ